MVNSRCFILRKNRVRPDSQLFNSWGCNSGRQRKRWIDVVKYNMEVLQLDLMDVENRVEWRRRTRVADPSPEGFNTGWRRERVVTPGGRGWGVPLPSRLGSLGERCKLTQQVRSPGRKTSFGVFRAWKTHLISFPDFFHSLTYPWPLWNSLTFPGFPGEWSPWNKPFFWNSAIFITSKAQLSPWKSTATISNTQLEVSDTFYLCPTVLAIQYSRILVTHPSTPLPTNQWPFISRALIIHRIQVT